ncbi:MAG: D-glycero-beta-D-manno-heptose 1-phosphate adenylyltransferase, partial [Gemmatimonadaceae bacterium]
ETPLELMQRLQPDVLVKGGDYTEATIVGASDVRRRGGRVVVVPLTPGQSTTSIVEKLRGSS